MSEPSAAKQEATVQGGITELKLAYKKDQFKSDEELIAACLAENSQAQSCLFHRFASRMLGVCYRYARNRTEAEDIMQDGFIKVFMNLRSFRRDASLETWITRIMVNTSLNHLKAKKRLGMESDLEVIYNHEEVSAVQLHQIDARVLMERIRELPDGYRVVLNMYAIEGYSHKEIAEHLEINESTSRSQFSRAKSLLEKKISTLGLRNDKKYAGE